MDLVKAVDRPPTIKCIDSIMPCYRYRLQDIVPRILQVYLEMGWDESILTELVWDTSQSSPLNAYNVVVSVKLARFGKQS